MNLVFTQFHGLLSPQFYPASKRSTINQNSLFEICIAIQYIIQTKNKNTHSHSKFSSPNLSKDYCGHKKQEKKLLWNSRFSFEDAPILLCILMGCVSTLQSIQIDFPLLKIKLIMAWKDINGGVHHSLFFAQPLSHLNTNLKSILEYDLAPSPKPTYFR